MLRMEFYEYPDCMKLRMEGRFVRDFAEHAKTLIGSSTPPSKLVVDLSEVSYVDAIGEEVLLWFKDNGVTFTAESAYSHDVCGRLQLPLEGEPPDPQHQPHRTRKRVPDFPPDKDRNPIPLQGETQL